MAGYQGPVAILPLGYLIAQAVQLFAAEDKKDEGLQYDLTKGSTSPLDHTASLPP